MFKLKSIPEIRYFLKNTDSCRFKSRPFYRCLYASATCFKQRKTKEERKLPKMLIYSPKSKWKETEVVGIWRNMTLSEVGKAVGKDVNHVLDVMTFIDNTVHYRKPNQIIEDFEIIKEIVKKSGKRWELASICKGEDETEELKDIVRRKPSEYKDLRPRPPVVTIMGHVDHGKTTLLDTLRESSIVEQEFGGITQHIGAFSVKVGKDNVTFLDTPGHAAFYSMRSRGAECTDIVVLVVAADDGVMEQTVESINMAKLAEVPIIVAVNKIDKPQTDIERTKKMLVQHDVQVEDFGGDVQVVPISALKGTNVNTLIDAILVQSELMELKSDYSGFVEAVVIESSTDTFRGKLCTVVIQCGTLKRGAILVAGTAWCKVRSMFNDKGDNLQEAPPSTPVQILGWRDLPSAGDLVLEVESEKKAAKVISYREEQEENEKLKEDLVVIEQKAKEHYVKYREQLEAKRKIGRFRVKPSGPRKKLYEDDNELKLSIVIKGDVDGSVEAILDVLDTYENNICKLNLIHYGIGPVCQNDIVLAEAFNAIIYTFNTNTMKGVKGNVPIKHHNVIYKLIDDVKSEVNKLLPEKDVEEIIGEATVLQEFIINEGKSKVPVAGCRCIKGILKKSLVKVIREEEEIYNGSISSLKHLKDEVDTIKKDVECGLKVLDSTLNFRPGDTIVCYKLNKVPQTINWDPGF